MQRGRRRGAGRAAHRDPRRRPRPRPAAGRRRAGCAASWSSRTARWSRSSPPATILATGGLGGLYAVTTNPRELRGEGLALAALAGAAHRRSRVRAVPPHRHRHRRRSRAAGHRGPARRRRGAGRRRRRSRSWPATIPTAELAPRDVVARAIHARSRDGRGAFLDAREAVGEHFPDEFPAVFAACMAGGIDPRRAADPGRAGRPLPHGRGRHRRRRPHLAGRPLRRRRMRLDRRARRQPPGLQLPAGSRGVRRPRRPRGARAEADPETAPLPCRRRARPARRGPGSPARRP